MNSESLYLIYMMMCVFMGVMSMIVYDQFGRSKYVAWLIASLAFGTIVFAILALIGLLS